MGKIGIFLPGQHGDIMQAMSVLKYKDILWPGKDIVWFCGEWFRDVLKHNDAISEVRWWPCGWGMGNEKCIFENIDAAAKGKPLWGDFSVLKASNNHLEQSRKHEFDQTKDLDRGVLPGTLDGNFGTKGRLATSPMYPGTYLGRIRRGSGIHIWVLQPKKGRWWKSSVTRFPTRELCYSRLISVLANLLLSMMMIWSESRWTYVGRSWAHAISSSPVNRTTRDSSMTRA